jgi:hypothetical protein
MVGLLTKQPDLFFDGETGSSQANAGLAMRWTG